ncbi:hypothetical protein EU642_22080 [Salmonella enterica]|nr:hypothetical protein [Salmonella enterica]EAO0118543.1 hypothetical protein [Salmonella enterica]EAO3601648.1 hypothetical protein [Salmonella enterica]EAR6391541.1 hypothetical protein [Salmonella enterica]EAV1285305.1 hypothetical protein [Salmonella enterica]
MFTTAAPTDQRAGVKPIAFTLQTVTGISNTVTLKIRPEDLTRTETQRTTTSQAMGRGVIGWVDHFGEGLPSVNISGHTGWRTAQGSGEDGAQAFESLNNLVMHAYPDAVQNAIDNGQDPSQVRLIFVDMLDDFSWVVVPQQFILRRSKSRPLLFQYTMQLQCISTDLENPLMILPFMGSLSSGMKALNNVVKTIEGFGDTIEGWIQTAVNAKNAVLSPITHTVKQFHQMSTRVFNTVNSVISTGKNAINGTANDLIGIASDVAKVGINLHRTIANLQSVPQDVMHSIMRVAGAYTEAFCILNNSMRVRKTYQNYDGLFGASNCSSTTGGSQPSAYANMNAFALMNDRQKPITLDSAAQSSISSLGNADPVLAPMSVGELNRHATTVLNGMKING